MSALLIIVIFLLMVFTLAQFFLSDILSGRNEALDRLNKQVAELAEVLALEKKSSKQLREDLAQISLELETSEADRTSLKSSLDSITSERDQLAEILLARTQDRDRLVTAVNKANQLGKEFEKELGAAREIIAADRDKIALQLATLKSLENDITALKLAKNMANIGDAKTLVIHPESTIYRKLEKHQAEQAGVFHDLIRISVGIEDSVDIISDFDQALAQL